jgi:hypothetical protein
MIITSDVYSKDFKNFVMPYDVDCLQVVKTLNKYIALKDNIDYNEYR